MKHMKTLLLAATSLCHLSIQTTVKVVEKWSPNYDKRFNKIKNKFVEKPEILVLHYTAVDTEKTLEIFQNKKSKVTSHYTIDEDGTIYQHVNDDMRARHAGKSQWRNYPQNDINSYSIGVEHINFGYWRDEPGIPKSNTKIEGSNHLWYPYKEKQIKSSIALAQKIIGLYKIKERNVVGHSDVSPGRKVDPGPCFPWEKLAKYGVGLWYNLEKKYNNEKAVPQGISIPWIQKNLETWGYKPPLNGKLDEKTKAIVKSFQMHYRPSNISGDIDRETMIILNKLLAQVNYQP